MTFLKSALQIMAAGLGSHLIRLLVVLAALTPEGVSVPRGGAIRAPARRLLHVGGPLVRDTASEVLFLFERALD